MELKAYARYCNPTRWVAAVTNLLLRWVCQRCILIFLTLELLLTAVEIWFFYDHPDVASLGVYFTSWKTHCCMTGARALICLFGVFAVGMRAVSLTKVYYGLFFCGGVLAVLVVLPIWWTECDCTDWVQCRVLRSFEHDSSPPILNPFPEPNSEHLVKSRHMPYAEAPTDPEHAKPFKDELLKDRDQKVQGSAVLETNANVGTESVQDDAYMTLRVETDAFGHGRLVNKRRSTQLSMAPEPDPVMSEQPVEKMEGSLILLEQEWKLKRKPKDGKKVNATPEEPHALNFFNITSDTIWFAEQERPQCKKRGLTDSEKADIIAQLKSTRVDPGQVDLDPELTSELFLCITDPLCGAVSAHVFLNNTESEKPWTYKICQRFLQLVPQPGNGSTKQNFTVYFLKNPIAIMEDLEATDSQPNKFFTEAFKEVDTKEGMKMIQKLYQADCLCDDRDDLDGFKEGSCRTYKDTFGKNRYWCWVRESSRKACQEEGTQMFWDDKQKRIWSEELCNKADCRCSHLGMLPHDLKAPTLNKSLLSTNNLNYGGSCKRWNTNNDLKWCYVGYDTRCPDRTKFAERWVSMDSPETYGEQRLQYLSSLPCDEDQQRELIKRAADDCETISMFARPVLLVMLLLYFPMVVILFKFLSNRCGDEFKAEEQFAVILSSDDESEDEGDAGKKKQGDSRGATEPKGTDGASEPEGNGGKGGQSSKGWDAVSD